MKIKRTADRCVQLRSELCDASREIGSGRVSNGGGVKFESRAANFRRLVQLPPRRCCTCCSPAVPSCTFRASNKRTRLRFTRTQGLTYSYEVKWSKRDGNWKLPPCRVFLLLYYYIKYHPDIPYQSTFVRCTTNEKRSNTYVFTNINVCTALNNRCSFRRAVFDPRFTSGVRNLFCRRQRERHSSIFTDRTRTIGRALVNGVRIHTCGIRYGWQIRRGFARSGRGLSLSPRIAHLFLPNIVIMILLEIHNRILEETLTNKIKNALSGWVPREPGGPLARGIPVPVAVIAA